jgi:hypothetical protein
MGYLLHLPLRRSLFEVGGCPLPLKRQHAPSLFPCLKEKHVMNMENMQYRTRRSFLRHSAALVVMGITPALRAQSLGVEVSLADFGGVPGGSAASIIQAFNRAFDHLKSLGGGTLTIPPGIYYLGNYAEPIYLIGVRDLQNVEISGYGATLEMTTMRGAFWPTVTIFFNLTNPSNVTIRGLKFYDYGTDVSTEWLGAVCVEIVATRPCAGIRIYDCVADHVVAFVRSFGRSETKYLLTGCEFNGTVRNAYYGVCIQYNASFSSCNLDCYAVRRAFIGHDVRNWNITIRATSEDHASGSNGLVCLIPFAGGTVEDCSVALTLFGNIDQYSSLLHFYHQAEGGDGYMRNIHANVTVNSAIGRGTLFLFDHALSTGVVPITSRTWENITLTGNISGSYNGRVIANPSVSTGTSNSIRVSSALITAQDLALLPQYISSFNPG